MQAQVHKEASLVKLPIKSPIKSPKEQFIISKAFTQHFCENHFPFHYKQARRINFIHCTMITQYISFFQHVHHILSRSSPHHFLSSNTVHCMSRMSHAIFILPTTIHCNSLSLQLLNYFWIFKLFHCNRVK